MLRGEALGGGETCSGFDHGAHDGVQGVGIARQEGRECEEALGEPGTVVEESRGSRYGGEIDLDGRATERLEAPQRGVEEPLGLAVPEELQTRSGYRTERLAGGVTAESPMTEASGRE